MGLKIKSMHEVFNNLMEWITAKTDKITDFNVGSAIRTLTEAIAIQFEEFYFSMRQNIVYAIENSVYSSFGFNLELSKASTGYVTVTFEEPLPSQLTFPKDTIFCTSSVYGFIYFHSTEEITAGKGFKNVLIPVKCKSDGTIGNVPRGSITTIVTTNSIIKSVENTTDFTNGSDEETSAERKRRFQNYVRTLARGTRDAIMYGTLEVSKITGAYVDDSYIGYVKVYAHNSDGNLPPELKKEVIENLNNYRAAGIEVEVLPIIKKSVNLSLEVIIGDDYDVQVYNELLRKLVIDYLNGYSVSNNLYMSDIMYAVKSSYSDIIINIIITDGTDTSVFNNELIRAGNVSVTCKQMKDWRS